MSTSADSLCFSGNTVDGDLIRNDAGRDRSVVFVLDPTKSPGRIAMYSRDMPWGVMMARSPRAAEFGIYKFEGDNLIIAVRQGGAPPPLATARGARGGFAADFGPQPPNAGPPPEKFESTLGSGVTLLVLQRLVLKR